ERWPGGEEDLSALFATLAGRVEVRDAASDADLDRIAHELLARGDGLAAGTAGLAAALAREMGLGPPPAATSPRCARPMALVGSLAAAGQAEYARSRGWPGRCAPLRGLPRPGPGPGAPAPPVRVRRAVRDRRRHGGTRSQGRRRPRAGPGRRSAATHTDGPASRRLPRWHAGGPEGGRLWSGGRHPPRNGSAS